MNKSDIHISITGHRPSKLKGGYDLESNDNKRLKQELKAHMIKYVEEYESVTFYQGGALGVDTIFALIALELKKQFPLIVNVVSVIPCSNQSERWNDSDKKRYEHILNASDEVIYVSNKRYTNSCMFERNKILVEKCDILIAVYNPKKPSGSSFTVNLAKQMGKTVSVHGEQCIK